MSRRPCSDRRRVHRRTRDGPSDQHIRRQDRAPTAIPFASSDISLGPSATRKTTSTRNAVSPTSMNRLRSTAPKPSPEGCVSPSPITYGKFGSLCGSSNHSASDASTVSHDTAPPSTAPRPAGRHPLRKHHPKRHGRVEVRPGDSPQRIDHHHHGEPQRKGHAHHPRPAARCRM